MLRKESRETGHQLSVGEWVPEIVVGLGQLVDFGLLSDQQQQQEPRVVLT
jgi:hypothetical protein